MRNLLPDSATVDKKQLQWLKRLADDADNLSKAKDPRKDLTRLRDELRALTISVSKANPWQ